MFGVAHLTTAPVYAPRIQNFSDSPSSAAEEEEGKDPSFTDFPFDGISEEFCLAGWTDCNGFLKVSDELLPSILPVQKECVQDYRILLKNPLVFKISCEGSPQIKKTFGQLLKLTGLKVFAVGGHLRDKLGKEWFAANGCRLVAESCIKRWMELCPSSRPAQGKTDVDFRCEVDHGDQALDHAEKIIKELASSLDIKADREKLESCVRQKGSAFLNYHPLVSFSEGEMVTDAFLVTYENASLNIDLVFARISEESLFTIHDLSLDITAIVQDDKLPQNFYVEPNALCVWQAIIDYLGKNIHLRSLSHMAWIRMISLTTLLFRHKCPIPEQLYLNLKNYQEKHTAPSQAIIRLLKHDLEAHHREDPLAGLFLTFNACANLQDHGAPAKEITDIWRAMYSPKSSYHPDSFLQPLAEAQHILSFDLARAIIEVASTLKLLEQPEGRPLDQGSIFLTKHDGRPAVLIFEKSLTLLCTLDIEKSLACIVEACTDYLENNKDRELQALEALLGKLNLVFSFSPISSPIQRHGHTIKNSESLKLLAQQMLHLPLNNLKALAYGVLYFCHCIQNAPYTGSSLSLIVYLPSAVHPYQKKNCSDLISFLKHQVVPHIPSLDKQRRERLLQGIESYLDAGTKISLRSWLCTLAELKTPAFKGMIFSVWAHLKDPCVNEELFRFISLQNPKDHEKCLEESLRYFRSLHSIGPEEVHILEALFQAVYSQNISKMPSKLRALLEAIHKMKLQSVFLFAPLYSRCLNDLMLNSRLSLALDLLIFTSENNALPMHEETACLWLQCCSQAFQNWGYSKCAIIWEKGHDLLIWKQRPPSNQYRGFLAEFIKALFKDGSAAANILGHEALELIPLSRFDDEHAKIFEELRFISERKKHAAKKAQEESKELQRGLENSLKKPASALLMAQLKEEALLLIDALCQQMADKGLIEECLPRLRLLAINPLVKKLWQDEPAQWSVILIRILESAYRPPIPDEGLAALLKFVECLLTSIDFVQLPFEESVRFLSIMLAILRKKTSLSFPDSLRRGARSALPSLLTLMKNTGRLAEIIPFLYELINSGMHPENIPAKLFLEYAHPALMQSLSVSKKKKSSLSEEDHHLLVILEISSIDEPLKLFNACYALVNALIEINLRKPLSNWIFLLAQLNRGPQLLKNPDAAKKLFVLVQTLYASNLTGLALTLLQSLESNHLLILKKISKAIQKLPHDFLSLSPTFFGRALVDHAPRANNQELLNLKKKAEIAASILLAKNQSMLAFEVHTLYPTSLNRTFARVLDKTAELRQLPLLERSWEVYKKKEMMQRSGIDSLPADRKWLHCWLAAMKVVKILSQHREHYLSDLEKEFDLFFDQGSSLLRAVEHYVHITPDEDPVKDFLRYCLEAIKVSERHVEFLKKITNRRLLLENTQNGQRLHDLDLLIIEHSAKSHDPTLFEYALHSVEALFKRQALQKKTRHKQKDRSRLGNLLTLLFRNSYQFNKDNHVYVIFQLNKTFTQLKSVVSRKLKLELESIIKKHPSIFEDTKKAKELLDNGKADCNLFAEILVSSVFPSHPDTPRTCYTNMLETSKNYQHVISILRKVQCLGFVVAPLLIAYCAFALYVAYLGYLHFRSK